MGRHTNAVNQCEGHDGKEKIKERPGQDNTHSLEYRLILKRSLFVFR